MVASLKGGYAQSTLDSKPQDEYAWLADPDVAVVKRQLRLEGAFFEDAMRPLLPLRMKLYSEMAALLPKQYEGVADEHGGWEYFMRTSPKQDLPRYIRRPVLLDLVRLANQHGYAALGTICPSADHSMLAYTLDLRGDESFELWVVEAASGRVISRVPDVLAAEWANGTNLVYTHVDDRGRPHAAMLHALGNSSAASVDTLLFHEPNDARIVDIAASKRREWISVNSNSRSSSEVWLLDCARLDAPLQLVSPRAPGVRYFVEAIGTDGWLLVLSNAAGAAPPSQATGQATQDTSTRASSDAHADSEMAARARTRLADTMTDVDANEEEEELPNTSLGLGVVHASALPCPPERWQPLRPPCVETPIEDVDIFRDWLELGLLAFLIRWLSEEQSSSADVLVLYERRFGIQSLRVLRIGTDDSTSDDQRSATHSTSPPMILDERLVQLPTAGAPCKLTASPNRDFTSDLFNFEVSSPTLPRQAYSCHMPSGELKLRAALEEPPQSLEGLLHCEQRWAVASAGVRIPVTIAHRRGIAIDKSAPLLVMCYGAYGACLDTDFRPEWAALMLRGWVVAFAHVRGGGELGPRWHAAGRLLSKPASARDLRCAVESLHEWGYSQPERTAAAADSAGGLALGGLLNAAPELLGAALLRSAFLDPYTPMVDAALPLTAEDYEEWGDPATDEAVMQCMLAYSPYHNLSDRPYPPTLYCVGQNDRRVPCTQSLRFIARLRHRTAQRELSAMPQLIHVRENGGHMPDGGRYRRLEQLALEYAFLTKAVGLENTTGHPLRAKRTRSRISAR